MMKAENSVRLMRRNEAGFTLLETLVGTLVLLTMLTLAFSLLDEGQETFMAQNAAELAQSRARKAINLMAREINLAGCAPVTIKSGPQPGLQNFSSSVTADVTSIRIVADRDGSGTTNGTGSGGDADVNDDVSYYLSGGTLWRSAPNDPTYRVNGVAAPQPVIEGVSQLAITYFDANGAQLTGAVNLSAVRMVNISLTTSAPTFNAQARNVTVTARVVLRNMQLTRY